MAELLLELFSEEIPARMQAKAGEDLARLLTEAFSAAGLKTDAPIVHTGPRRLAIVFPDLPERTQAVREERKGPRVGAPDKAIEGFLKSAGLSSVDQCEKQSDAKGEFYVAVVEKPGRDVRDLLGEIVPAVCDAMPWPKSMRWADRSERWVRPLQRIVCLFGAEIASVEWAGIKAGDQTEGHRIHGRGPFRVSDFASYRAVLESQGHVRIGRAERLALIAERARAICEEAGLELVQDEALLDEVAGLAEWPVPLLGEFDPAFLDVPPEVIQLTMAKNQKYFAVRDPKTGALAPRFVAVADLQPKDGGAASAKGYARVLSARLSDARFFWDEDRSHTLESRVDDLERVVFHRELGSVRDKAQRVSALARELAPLCGADPDLAARAGLLAKADLTTSMVQEFTDLQGVIGAYYVLEDARSDDPPPPAGEGDHEVVEGAGAAQSVANAIRDHYKPLGPSDAVPTEPVSVAVALADKLDTLVAFWAVDEKPTGSKDPYALRRAALGVIRLLLESKTRIRLGRWIHLHADELVTQCYYNINLGVVDWIESLKADERSKLGPDAANIRIKRVLEHKITQYEGKGILEVLPEFGDNLAADLLAFFADRLKVALREQGVRHDLIDAVFALGEDDLVAIVARVKALQSFLATPEGENLLAGAKRAMNIVEAEEKKGFTADDAAFDENLLTAPEEKALAAALDAARALAAEAVEREDYEAAMAAIAPLRPAIDAFFDKVTVNDPDPSLRTNRLLLLRRIRDALGAVADFSKIGG